MMTTSLSTTTMRLVRCGVAAVQVGRRALSQQQHHHHAVIDLRSDTVTVPSQRMREAMVTAVVGDDVYGEDPTVNELERYAAELLGKEQALFVPTGCMGNAISIAAHCQRGDELICGDRSHIFNYEGGNASTLFGVAMHPIRNRPDGTFDLEDAHAALRPDDPHFTHSRLVCVENTHNMCGGKVAPLSFINDVRAFCDKHGLKLHMDGARVGNAAAALEVPVSEIVAPVDTVSLCLSKGLGAPVGSIVAGPADFMYHARRTRKLLGGGMRQAGIIAAAGMMALKENLHRMHVDHAHAKELARNLSTMNGIDISLDDVHSNIIVFALDSPLKCADYVAALKERGVLVGLGYDPRVIRAVTHLNVSSEDIEDASERFKVALDDIRAKL
ncbi:threonine aldolase [Salpingoeca rosetta]|uniref:Threonine aldolase n=1 Tax=Salpingoeca rosetta (strain ATCC 50818 / BSB-021) TaxID=946362 RepID=F2UEX0_SALR5|nr:threonine aldolase [Salpingoeca rosetta]EGD75170.1 threonine aldolase [Salpingoeca rosetta]|eukprot:XP_004992223.1 threonine aldolase [Salpingoeca rosetta]